MSKRDMPSPSKRRGVCGGVCTEYGVVDPEVAAHIVPGHVGVVVPVVMDCLESVLSTDSLDERDDRHEPRSMSESINPRRSGSSVSAPPTPSRIPPPWLPPGPLRTSPERGRLPIGLLLSLVKLPSRERRSGGVRLAPSCRRLVDASLLLPLLLLARVVAVM